MNFDVSIVIPAKNEGETIGQCLKAIHEQDTRYGYEVIVIDSGSTDNTLDTVKTYTSIRLIEIKPQDFGHGKTRNMSCCATTYS